MKIIYLAAHIAELKYEDAVYQDIKTKRDIGGCMLEVDLSPYDVIVATPPCNYYSKANYRRETSAYSQETKHLLPNTVKRLVELGKPFIVENVKNRPLMKDIDEYCGQNGITVLEWGRHTYFTNLTIPVHLPKLDKDRVQDTTKKHRQGGEEVNYAIEYLIDHNIKIGKIS